MAKPIVRVLIPEDLEQAFSAVATVLESLSLALTNPENKKITTWTEEGDQREIASAEVFANVKSEFISNIQFWNSADEDVFVAWDSAKDGWIFSIYLAGVNSVLAMMLMAKLAEMVLIKYRLSYGHGSVFSIEFE